MKRGKAIGRGLAKLAVFALGLLLLLFPRVDLAFRQVGHFKSWEKLVDPKLPVMAAINAEIDKHLPPQATPQDELAFVQSWVERQIKYRFDWYSYGNVDYWPTAAEVWEARREDCDGRAVLAASILQARGFTTARLAVNLQHVWVVVEPNDPKLKSTQAVGLMSPAGKEGAVKTPGGRMSVRLPDWQTLKQSLALSAYFPAWRQLLLVGWLLVMLWYPCRWSPSAHLPLLLGVLSVLCFHDWASRTVLDAGEGQVWQFFLSLCLLGAAVVLTLRRRSQN